MVATVLGCEPGAAVALELGGRPVASSVADATGSFSAPIDVGDLAVGRYEVLARCGVVLSSGFDVVLVSRVDPGTATVVVLLLFFLLAAAAIRRQAS